MSLISLSSVDTNNIVSQQPFNFKNNFPQPLVIKPNSQVALLNFYHFRDDTQYHITSQNNKILYNFAAPDTNGRWEATLIPNIYNGTDLAVEIARALNLSNVAFQNFLFTCVFTQGNQQANPPTDDQFAITYASVPTPASRGGTWAEFGADGNCGSFVNADGDNTVSTLGVGTLQSVPTYQARNEFGIHNHEGTWECKGFSNFGRNFGFNNAGTAYDFNWGSHAVALFEVKRTDTNSSDPKTIFSRDRPTIQITVKSLVGQQIKIQTLRNGQLVTKRTLATNLFDSIRDIASGGVAASRCDYLLGFKYFKAAGADVATQLQYSIDGGVNWIIATEADNTGANFGVNLDGIPNVMSATTITGNQVNGIIYHSGQNGMRLVDNSVTSLVAAPNILQKSKGKFECFLLGNSGSTIPHTLGAGSSKFELTGRKISVDYGGGVSFDIDITAHAGGQAFQFNVAGSNQQGVAGGNQARATDFNGRALKMNLTKNGLGLVWDIYADDTDAGSAVIGELKLNRRGTGGSNFGRIDFLNLTGGSFNGATSILAATIDALVRSTSTIPMVLTNSGIYNQSNLQILSNGSPLLSGHFANTDYLNEEPDSVSEPELSANLPATFAMLLNRITQHDVDTVAGIAASPLKLAVGTRSGTIGSLIGFSDNFVFDSTGAETRTYTSDIATQITSKDTTLHISIPELSNVKSFEGESSQVYKTIKVLPKADFNSDKNSGSLNYSAPYEDYIDINNGTEFQTHKIKKWKKWKKCWK